MNREKSERSRNLKEVNKSKKRSFISFGIGLLSITFNYWIILTIPIWTLRRRRRHYCCVCDLNDFLTLMDNVYHTMYKWEGYMVAQIFQLSVDGYHKCHSWNQKKRDKVCVQRFRINVNVFLKHSHDFVVCMYSVAVSELRYTFF